MSPFRGQKGFGMIQKYLSDLQGEFRGYNVRALTKDLFAGLTAAAVALPLALAFGVSSGADAAAGLITAIISGFVISAFSGAYYQISGPTGAMSAILISVTAKYHLEGVFLATLLAGILLIFAGIFHLGRLTAFIPSPVITGFTSGIAVIIALGQLDNLLGVRSTGESALARLASLRDAGHSLNFSSLAIGAFVIIFMLLFPKKLGAAVPASLVGIAAATILAAVLGLDADTVGEIPKTLVPDRRLTPPDITPGAIANLVLPSISIASLGMVESLMCGASAGRMTGVRLDNDRELVAQGIGNLLLPFFGGIPATAAIARTSVAIKSGAKTRLTGIFHAAGLLLTLFFLGPAMSKIPLASLAGVLVVTAWRMNDLESIRFIFSRNFKGGILKYLITMVSTVVFDLTTAILIGVALALVLLVRRLSKIEINCEKVDESRMAGAGELSGRFRNACVVYITGPVIFANTQHIEKIPDRIPPGCDAVLLSMRGVSHLDVSGVQTLLAVLTGFKARGIDFAICGLPDGTKEIICRSGIAELAGENGFFWSVERALTGKKPIICA